MSELLSLERHDTSIGKQKVLLVFVHSGFLKVAATNGWQSFWGFSFVFSRGL